MTRDEYLSRFERWIGGSKQRKVAARAELEEHLGAAERAGELEAAMDRLGDPRAAARDFSAGYALTPSPIPQRLAAALIDLGVLVALVVTGLVQGTWAATRQGDTQDVAVNVAGQTKHLVEMPVLGIALVLLGVAWVVAFWVLEWRTGRTLGKAALGLRIVSEDGTAASFWQIVVRNLTLIFSGPLQLFDWGFVFINPKHQRAFDIVAKTIVVVEGGRAAARVAAVPSI